MPTDKRNRDRKKYQREYYLKYRNEWRMDCPVCWRVVQNYPRHCDTKLHKEKLEAHKSKLAKPWTPLHLDPVFGPWAREMQQAESLQK